MKKYILVLIMIVSPLMAQEKNTEIREYKRPVFGLNSDFGLSYVPISHVGLVGGIVPEFYIGKQRKTYFYLQLPLQFQGLYSYNNIASFFGIGVLIGMGGYILEADIKPEYDNLVRVDDIYRANSIIQYV
ncbi:MAG: hypothetical protein ACRCTQ_00460 [Brevinemataceae bacterium]